ncbi:hypothetical protein Pfra02_05970 [Pseudomonas fragi]|nr:hypothetical protein Pfra02_05970 [Pseudomonas fragi]
MITQKYKAKNPLTVIAIFSMLTQASASISLPYINNENQEIYVWFLIIFPLILIVLFFITLNFNNKSLYSPSDFTNETNFITTNIDRAHPQNGGSTHFTRSDVPAYKKALDWANVKLTLCRPQSLIFLPQGHRDYDSTHCKRHKIKTAPGISPATKEASTPQFIALKKAGTDGLHIANLTHPNLRILDINRLEEVLHRLNKALHPTKNILKKNTTLILLINHHINALMQDTSLTMHTHKKNQLMENTRVITYNTQDDAIRLPL